ncbi:MAG: hypothetical protein P4M05_05770 [Bradyrhizobium sp.]|nr:hypothetical protein [Bradyrhizobium sp.]
MARLPPSGAAIATPFQLTPTPRVLSEFDLREVLIELCPDAAFAETDIAAAYLDLQRILGRWHAEQGRPDTASMAADLAKLGEDLELIIAAFSSIEGGLHHVHDVELVSKLVDVLSQEPSCCGSRQEAHDLIVSFRRSALEISNACRKGAMEFRQYVGKSGRPKLDWYDDFKTLLIKIARLGGVEPSMRKDRITQVRTGWLITAAQKLETFLDPAMRSPDSESCGKRLERARVVQDQ